MMSQNVDLLGLKEYSTISQEKLTFQLQSLNEK